MIYRCELPGNVRQDVTIALGYEGNRHGWFNPVYEVEPWLSHIPKYERWIQDSEPTQMSATVATAEGVVVRAFDGPSGPTGWQFSWNGRDENGALVAAGPYTVTVRAEEQTSEIQEL